MYRNILLIIIALIVCQKIRAQSAYSFTIDTIARRNLEYTTYDLRFSDAGNDQTVNVSDTVTLDGSGSSDEDGDTLSYTWFFMSAPVGSSILLYNYTSVNPYFTPDLAGDYIFLLAVSDGIEQGKPDKVIVQDDP